MYSQCSFYGMPTGYNLATLSLENLLEYYYTAS